MGADVTQPIALASPVGPVKGDTTGRAAPLLQAQKTLGLRLERGDCRRLRGAYVDTDAAARATARIEPVGIRLDPDDLMRTEPRASIAAGTALRIDMGRMETEAAIFSCWKQTAGGHEATDTGLGPFRELRGGIGCSGEDAPKKRAAAERLVAMRGAGRQQTGPPLLRSQGFEIKGFQPAIGDESRSLVGTRLDAAHAPARTGITIAQAKPYPTYAVPIQAEQGTHAQDVRTGNNPRPFNAGPTAGQKRRLRTLYAITQRRMML